MDVASKHKISILTSPNYGFKHFVSNYEKTSGNYNWDLSNIKAAYNAAEPVSYELCEEFETKLEPYGLRKNTVRPAYGMSEATAAISISYLYVPISLTIVLKNSLVLYQKIVKANKKSTETAELVPVGKALGNCEIRICGEEDEILEDLYLGEIQIRGSNVTSGYINNHEATSLAFTKDGWLKTGDIGFLNDGNLTVTGRLKDIIIINGVNIYPTDIEELLIKSNLCTPGNVAVCGVDDMKQHTQTIIIFYVSNTQLEKEMVNIRTILNEKMSLYIGEIIPVNEIPKTNSGKIQRHKLIESYKSGELDSILKSLIGVSKSGKCKEINKLNSIDIKERLVEMCIQCFGIDDIGFYDNFIEQGADSYHNYIGDKQSDYKLSGYIDCIDEFDHDFFRITPKEAGLMDPNQRIFLQTVYHAIEDAGYYKMIDEVEPNSKDLAVAGNLKSIISSRISYFLDLKGPAINIDTACSSSLVALHLACKGIQNGDCQMGIVGSIKMDINPKKMI